MTIRDAETYKSSHPEKTLPLSPSIRRSQPGAGDRAADKRWSAGPARRFSSIAPHEHGRSNLIFYTVTFFLVSFIVSQQVVLSFQFGKQFLSHTPRLHTSSLHDYIRLFSFRCRENGHHLSVLARPSLFSSAASAGGASPALPAASAALLTISLSLFYLFLSLARIKCL